MATPTLRTTKGSALTYAELDDNFTNINNELPDTLTFNATTRVLSMGRVDSADITVDLSGIFDEDITAAGSLDLAGTLTLTDANPTAVIGSTNLSTGTASLSIGKNRTGSGYASINLVGDSSYSTYGLRILRSNTGENSLSYIQQRGTGDLVIQTQDAAGILFSTNSTTGLRIDENQNVNVITNLQTGGTTRLDSAGELTNVTTATQATGTNDTTLATTAFVQQELTTNTSKIFFLGMQ